MAKLPSELYVTVTYIDPERIKCANANCSRNGETRNRIDAVQLLATDDSNYHLWVRLYFCDECYPRYKAAINAVANTVVPANWSIQPNCDCDVCKLAKSVRCEPQTNPFEEANEAFRQIGQSKPSGYDPDCEFCNPPINGNTEPNPSRLVQHMIKTLGE